MKQKLNNLIVLLQVGQDLMAKGERWNMRLLQCDRLLGGTWRLTIPFLISHLNSSIALEIVSVTSWW